MKAFAIVLMLWLTAVASSAEELKLTLAQLQQEALRVAPDLQSQIRQLEAARAAARQAGRRPNPELYLSADEEEQQITLAQTFDIWGKRPIARRMGLARAEVREAELAKTRLAVLHEVAIQFWTLADAERRLALLDDELADWQKLIAIRKGEVEAGEIAVADLFNSQSIAAKRRQARWRLLETSTAARAALNLMAGRSAGAALEIEIPVWQQVGTNEPADPQQAIAQALSRNPLLGRIRARLESAGLRIRKEERSWVPDPKIGAFARQASDGTIGGIMVRFSLPVFDRNQDGVRAANFDEAAVQAELRSAELLVAQEAYIAFQILAQTRSAFEESSELVNGLLAQQQELVKQSFEIGEISERDLLVARIKWTRHEQELEALRARLGLAKARLSHVLSAEEAETNFKWTQSNYRN